MTEDNEPRACIEVRRKARKGGHHEYLTITYKWINLKCRTRSSTRDHERGFEVGHELMVFYRTLFLRETEVVSV